MVTADRLKSDNSFRVSITPNRSISWRGNLLFVFLVSVPLTIIALGFLYAGAPIILPFAGLEILLVLTALYFVFKDANRKEILTFTPEKLIIEKGRLRPETTTEFVREWAYVFVEKATHPWYPLHIIISSKGERVPIGDFLTEDDKKILIEKMDEIIQELRTV